jgi:hypothetical protein
MRELLSRPGVLASYPSWYQLLLVVWLLLTAALVGGFLLLKPVTDNTQTTVVSQATTPQVTITPTADGQLRLLAEVEDDVPLKRMPAGVRGYIYALSDGSKVSREKKEWTLEVNRRLDGSCWAIGYVSSETKAKFDRWQSDQSISDLQILMFTTTWEEAPEKISIPLAFLVSEEVFEFRNLFRRHEVQLSRKNKSTAASKQK